MSRKFLTNLDLNTNELLNAVVQNLGSDPVNGTAGQVYYNTNDDVLKIYSGTASAWVAVGSVEFIGDSVANLLEGGDGIYLNYDDASDTLTISNTGVLSLTGTSDEVVVSASAGNITLSLPDTINANTTGNAETATTLETARTISLGGSLSGSASFDGSSDITITASIGADSVTLGTNTTGDYVESLTAGSGIDISDGTGEGSTPTISNTGVLDLSGTVNQVSVSASTGSVTLSLPDALIIGDTPNDGSLTIKDGSGATKITLDSATDSGVDIQDHLSVGASAYFADDVAVQGDVTIQGNLNVDGTLNAINRTEINIEDNSIRLNTNLSASATPTVDSSIIIERGNEADVAIRWNESTDKWELTNDGSNYYDIVATDTFGEDVEDIVGGLVVGSSALYVNYNDGADQLQLDVTLQTASPSYLVKASGLAVDLPTLETQLISDSFTRKAAANVGNGVNLSFALVHNFGTRDVVVNVYDNSTYDTVETDVVRTNSNTVTVSFASAPSTNAYRVVIVG